MSERLLPISPVASCTSNATVGVQIPQLFGYHQQGVKRLCAGRIRNVTGLVSGGGGGVGGNTGGTKTARLSRKTSSGTSLPTYTFIADLSPQTVLA
jgi:hypothetical protein